MLCILYHYKNLLKNIQIERLELKSTVSKWKIPCMGLTDIGDDRGSSQRMWKQINKSFWRTGRKILGKKINLSKLYTHGTILSNLSHMYLESQEKRQKTWQEKHLRKYGKNSQCVVKKISTYRSKKLSKTQGKIYKNNLGASCQITKNKNRE